MDGTKNQGFTFTSSLFKPVKAENILLSQLETLTDQLINDRVKSNLVQKERCSNLHHPFTQIIYQLIFTLRQRLRQEQTTFSSTEIQQISFNLFQNLASMVQLDLFETNSKYSQELMTSILLEKHLLQIFKTFLMKNNRSIKLSELDSIMLGIVQPNYRKIYAGNLFEMVGGQFLIIDREKFIRTVMFIIRNIGKIFTSQINFITRNLKNIKKSKNINDILNCSVKLICSYENRDFVEGQVNRVTSAIFEQRTNLRKDEFVESLCKIEKNTISYVCWLLIDLLRVESLIVLDKDIKVKIQSQVQIEKSNFYIQEMQKMLKKCPYNGDECCSCKKCQCVRRNRESAKLSQEKKRNAVEQLDPMKKRVMDLQKRNKQLEEQNLILKRIFNELKGSHEFKQLLSATLEPVSKVLND